MRFSLQFQWKNGKKLNKPGPLILGSLHLFKAKDAEFFSDNGASYRMSDAKLDSVGGDVMMLTGYEISGTGKCYYQEWALRLLKEGGQP
jgi:hypothetical protein